MTISVFHRHAPYIGSLDGFVKRKPLYFRYLGYVTNVINVGYLARLRRLKCINLDGRGSFRE